MVFSAGGEMAALGERDVCADQVSSCHMTRMPHVHAGEREMQCFILLFQTRSEVRAKEEGRGPKQAGMSTTASNISAGSVC